MRCGLTPHGTVPSIDTIRDSGVNFLSIWGIDMQLRNFRWQGFRMAAAASLPGLIVGTNSPVFAQSEIVPTTSPASAQSDLNDQLRDVASATSKFLRQQIRSEDTSFPAAQ